MRTFTDPSKNTRAANRRRYTLLVEDVEADGFHRESYGVAVEDPVTGERSQARHVTVHAEEAAELLELLSKHQVSPVHLPDVVEDWFGR